MTDDALPLNENIKCVSHANPPEANLEEEVMSCHFYSSGNKYCSWNLLSTLGDWGGGKGIEDWLVQWCWILHHLYSSPVTCTILTWIDMITFRGYLSSFTDVVWFSVLFLDFKWVSHLCFFFGYFKCLLIVNGCLLVAFFSIMFLACTDDWINFAFLASWFPLMFYCVCLGQCSAYRSLICSDCFIILRLPDSLNVSHH